ncbi:pentapeptide repeat-containing protein [Streptomyces sp. NBC_00555]|uniref:pentapeptide repeat-containing protein n=1 Tax=Streptomyces sp. NBC_00555 TaxID=2903662 RepID=UPI00224F3B00|nr:pentapeptide repeat-containing protein [Streptomyces sp. NBC_00555]MCX5014938.1 pentapeptide repeat-containing protein [Streptomyces sp. NBC_00555]
MFYGATFTGSAWFREVTFTDTADFGDATFTGAAAFNGTTFIGSAWFDDATFTGTFSFDNARARLRGRFHLGCHFLGRFVLPVAVLPVGLQWRLCLVRPVV